MKSYAPSACLKSPRKLTQAEGVWAGKPFISAGSFIRDEAPLASVLTGKTAHFQKMLNQQVPGDL